MKKKSNKVKLYICDRCTITSPCFWITNEKWEKFDAADDLNISSITNMSSCPRKPSYNARWRRLTKKDGLIDISEVYLLFKKGPVEDVGECYD